MKAQELIDKIAEIKAEAKLNGLYDKDELEEKLNKIFKLCDETLLDWKMENARCLSQMKLS